MQSAITLIKEKTGKIELSVRGRKIYYTRKCRTNYEAESGYVKLKKQLAADGWRHVVRQQVQRRVRKAQEKEPRKVQMLHRYVKEGTVGDDE